MKTVKTLAVAAAVLGLLVGLGGCADSGAKVFQGACVSYDAQARRMVLKNDEPKLNPVPKTMPQVTFDLTGAKIGLVPGPGDRIRVAFRRRGESFVAVKVMNVTRQDLRKK